MKKLSFLILLLVALVTGFVRCKKDKHKESEPEKILETLDVNFYKPKITGEEKDVPQLTLKNSEVQVTAIGNNSNGVLISINKLYISDIVTNTEWVVLLDNNGKPALFYGINSLTKEKLADLYWIENKNETTYMLRYYDYDWNNRLGTLKYEAEITNGIAKVTFENQSTQTGQATIVNNVIGQKPSSSSNKSKSSKSFPVPIPLLNKLSAISETKNTKISAESSGDELDNWYKNEFMPAMKDLLSKGLHASCNVSKILVQANRNSICKLADQLEKTVNEQILNDLSKGLEQAPGGNDSEYEGASSRFSIRNFNLSNISANLDRISRHLNSIRSNITDGVGDVNKWIQDWYAELKQNAYVQTEDLNDLSDKNGVIQIGLSWNTTSDIDLHVTDPSGEEIWFDHPRSSSGGYLDRDDIDGYGPENIYWTNGVFTPINIPNGTYKVYVDYFGPDNGGPTSYHVKVINGLGFSKVYQGILTKVNDRQTVVSFTKNGASIVVQ